jgi:hypothetical protein
MEEFFNLAEESRRMRGRMGGSSEGVVMGID